MSLRFFDLTRQTDGLLFFKPKIPVIQSKQGQISTFCFDVYSAYKSYKNAFKCRF